MRKWLLALLSLIPVLAHSDQGDSSRLGRIVWVHAGTNLIEYVSTDAILYPSEKRGYVFHTGFKYELSPRFRGDLTYGYTTWDKIKVIPVYIDKSPAQTFTMSNYTKVSSHFVQLHGLFVFRVRKHSFMETGLFYSFAPATLELFVAGSEPASGTYTANRYVQSYQYHTAGVSLSKHYQVWDALYLTCGANIFYCINRPRVFDEIIRDFYKGASYIPGLGFQNFPLSLNIGLEYRIRFR